MKKLVADRKQESKHKRYHPVTCFNQFSENENLTESVTWILKT